MAGRRMAGRRIAGMASAAAAWLAATTTVLAAWLAATTTVLAAWLAATTTVLAASPSPASGAGDPRSSGQGPGLVGDPLVALFAVVAIGLVSVLATLAYIRLTARRGA
jgi:hypothetical protein